MNALEYIKIIIEVYEKFTFFYFFLTFYKKYNFQNILFLKENKKSQIVGKLGSKFDVDMTKKELSVEFDLGALANFYTMNCISHQLANSARVRPFKLSVRFFLCSHCK